MGLIIIFSASCLIRDSTIFGIFLTVTSNMYHTMSEKVLRSNILFFDSNPIGRILTRFSKDMAVMDLIAPSLSTMMTYGIFRALAVTISIVAVNYWIAIPIFVSICYLVYLMTKAQIVLLETQRLDSVVRGPIHSLFAMVVNGLVSIRAYGQLAHFQKSFMCESELSANVTFTYATANRWLGLRFDFVIYIVSLSASVFSVFMRN